MFGSLLKAVVGVVVETPVALVRDVVDVVDPYGSASFRNTDHSIKKVIVNLHDATKPEGK